MKESAMPHVIVKLWPGKSEKQKTRLAEAIAKSVMDIFDYGEESVSVAMEEIQSQDWNEKVLPTGHPWPPQENIQKTRIQNVNTRERTNI
jgi:4-oxalocrotonate tautomerase